MMGGKIIKLPSILEIRFGIFWWLPYTHRRVPYNRPGFQWRSMSCMFGIPFPSFLQIITNSHMPDIKDPGGMKVIYSCCPISWRKKTSAPPRWRVWKVQEDEVTMTPWHVTMTWMIWGTPPFHVKMPLTNSPIHPGMWVRIWALLLILLELDVQNIPKRQVSELIAKCCNIHCYFIYIYVYIYGPILPIYWATQKIAPLKIPSSSNSRPARRSHPGHGYRARISRWWKTTEDYYPVPSW